MKERVEKGWSEETSKNFAWFCSIICRLSEVCSYMLSCNGVRECV